MTNEIKERLKQECKDLIEKSDKLHAFFKTEKFYNLDRANKDLIYKQFRLMNEYIQVLGQRMELNGAKLSFSTKLKGEIITKEELVNLLIKNFKDKKGNLDISWLDFSNLKETK